MKQPAFIHFVQLVDNKMSQSTTENSAFRTAFTSAYAPSAGKGMTFTENGAVAHDGTGIKTLDFFNTVMARSKDTAMPDTTIRTRMSDSWDEDPEMTLRLLAHLRDIRGQGKGERHAAKICWQWLHENHPKQALHNMKHLPFYGRWKDLLQFFLGTTAQETAMQLFADQLRADLKLLKETESEPKKLAGLTLAAKWAPTEGCHEDKEAQKQGVTPPSYVLATLLSNADPESPDAPHPKELMKWYRQTYLSPLRKAIVLVEQFLCSKEFDSIDFGKVPSVALKMYSAKTFPKHCAERFAQWQQDVLKGKGKMNTDIVDPYQVVELFATGRATVEQKPTLEAFYKLQVEKLRDELIERYGVDNLEDSVVVVDVSASMTGTPMHAAIALGVWVSALVRDDWKDLIFTFSETPEVVDLSGCKSLEERVRAIATSPGIGYNTNIQALFDLMLTRAKTRGLTQSQMPKRLIIASDMQFDEACGDSHHRPIPGSGFTNLEVAKNKFRAAGYDAPQIVFWNLRGNTPNAAAATHDERGVTLLSGFSKNMLTAILEGGDVPTPYEFMIKVLSDPRYDLMTMA